jgi:hypothetical protein
MSVSVGELRIDLQRLLVVGNRLLELASSLYVDTLHEMGQRRVIE